MFSHIRNLILLIAIGQIRPIVIRLQQEEKAMSDWYYLDLDCAWCGEMNDIIYSSQGEEFTCEKCRKKNIVRIKFISVEKLYKLLDKFMEDKDDSAKLIIMEYLRFVSKHRNKV